jgi:hypothetical protein
MHAKHTLTSYLHLDRKECLLPGNRYRFITAFVLMFWQQFSGTNSIGKDRTLSNVEYLVLTIC